MFLGLLKESTERAVAVQVPRGTAGPTFQLLLSFMYDGVLELELDGREEEAVALWRCADFLQIVDVTRAVEESKHSPRTLVRLLHAAFAQAGSGELIMRLIGTTLDQACAISADPLDRAFAAELDERLLPYLEQSNFLEMMSTVLKGPLAEADDPDRDRLRRLLIKVVLGRNLTEIPTDTLIRFSLYELARMLWLQLHCPPPATENALGEVILTWLEGQDTGMLLRLIDLRQATHDFITLRLLQSPAVHLDPVVECHIRDVAAASAVNWLPIFCPVSKRPFNPVSSMDDAPTLATKSCGHLVGKVHATKWFETTNKQSCCGSAACGGKGPGPKMTSGDAVYAYVSEYYERRRVRRGDGSFIVRMDGLRKDASGGAATGASSVRRPTKRRRTKEDEDASPAPKGGDGKVVIRVKIESAHTDYRYASVALLGAFSRCLRICTSIHRSSPSHAQTPPEATCHSKPRRSLPPHLVEVCVRRPKELPCVGTR